MQHHSLPLATLLLLVSLPLGALHFDPRAPQGAHSNGLHSEDQRTTPRKRYTGALGSGIACIKKHFKKLIAGTIALTIGALLAFALREGTPTPASTRNSADSGSHFPGRSSRESPPPPSEPGGGEHKTET